MRKTNGFLGRIGELIGDVEVAIYGYIRREDIKEVDGVQLTVVPEKKGPGKMVMYGDKPVRSMHVEDIVNILEKIEDQLKIMV